MELKQPGAEQPVVHFLGATFHQLPTRSSNSLIKMPLELGGNYPPLPLHKTPSPPPIRPSVTPTFFPTQAPSPLSSLSPPDPSPLNSVAPGSLVVRLPPSPTPTPAPYQCQRYYCVCCESDMCGPSEKPITMPSPWHWKLPLPPLTRSFSKACRGYERRAW